MTKQRTVDRLLALALGSALCALTPAVAQDDVSFQHRGDRIEIRIGDNTFATYSLRDQAIQRPFFCQIFAPNGTQVSRLHPPDPVLNKDNADHETMHPGLWLAFGDVNGLDVWRNKARVAHERMVQFPAADGSHGTFTVLNAYGPLDGPVQFYETCRYDVHALDIGWFLVSRSVFQSRDNEIRFGDQEEMGLGMRLNTPLTVKFGSGAIATSDGGQNEAGTWGKSAKWCGAYGKANSVNVGMTLMPSPENFRPSWFHSRDYGLVVANPFGKKAMTGADDKAVKLDVTVVPKGQPFNLTFGVFVFAQPELPDNSTAYEWFQELLNDGNAPAAPLNILDGADETPTSSAK